MASVGQAKASLEGTIVWQMRFGFPAGAVPSAFIVSHHSLRNSYPPQSLKKICVGILSFWGVGGAPLSQYPTPTPETESYLLVTGAPPPLLPLGNPPTPYSPNFIILAPRQFNTTCCSANSSLNHQVTNMPALGSGGASVEWKDTWNQIARL